MIDNQAVVNRDILLLYELSISIGQSLDPAEACRAFIDVLMARKNLAYTAIWIDSSQLDNSTDDAGYTLFYAVPEIRAATRHLDADNDCFQFASGETYRTVRDGDPDFPKVVAEKGVETGAYALFNLRKVGLLKLYTRHDNAFYARELNQLSTVVDKFSIAVSGALAHKRLLVESNRREAAQRSLANQKALLRSLIDSVPDLIFYKDHDSVYLGCNRAFEIYANRKETGIIGRTDFDIFDREISEFYRAKDAEMMAAGIQHRNEEWIEYPDGRRVLLDTLKTPYYGPIGELVGLIGISRDITDRKLAEQEIKTLNSELETRVHHRTQELEEATAYNRMLFNTSPVGLLLSDMEGKLADVNPAYLDIIGYTEAQAKALSFWDITPKVYAQQEKVQRASLEKTGHYGPYEKEFLHKDGHLVPVRLNGLLVRRDHKKYIWSSVEDITKSKLAEQALIEAKESAEAASKAKSEFLSNMSHEIRTPMNAIIGMSYLALQADLDKRQRNYIENVHSSAKGLLRILNEILDFFTARLEKQPDQPLQHLPATDIGPLKVNAMSGEREKVLAAGINDHIAKPIMVNEMFRSLEKWITPGIPAIASKAGVPGAVSMDISELPELPGINIKAGLATTQGDVRLYRKLLLKFRANQGDFEQQFRAAQVDEEPEAAIRVAHTLKGVCGFIGAVGVQAAAQVLEQTCQAGGDDTEETLTAVMVELRPVLAGLKDLNDTPKGMTKATIAIDRTAVEPLLHELYALLANYNIKSADVVDKLEPLLNNTDYAGYLDRVSKAIEDYDFDKAFEVLEVLAGAADIKL